MPRSPRYSKKIPTWPASSASNANAGATRVTGPKPPEASAGCARWKNKRWPAEHFAALVKLLAKKFPDARFAILGSGEDRVMGEIIHEAEPSRSLNLCGEISYFEMVEWLRHCDLMITNDTGPMH